MRNVAPHVQIIRGDRNNGGVHCCCVCDFCVCLCCGCVWCVSLVSGMYVYECVLCVSVSVSVSLCMCLVCDMYI